MISGYLASLFTRHSDGVVTVDRWYPEQLISGEFMCQSNRWIHYDSQKEELTITVDNGKAVYRIIEHMENDIYRSILIESEIDLEV